MTSAIDGLTGSSGEEVYVAGPLEIRPSHLVAVVGGETMHLTRHEFGLLLAMARAAGAVIPREDLAELAWGRPLRPRDRSIDVYVRRLRHKLRQVAPDWEFIHTHFAFGYRFAAEAADPPARP